MTGGSKQQQILEVLKRSPGVDISGVKVRVVGDSIELRGEVLSPKESRAVENIVKNIPGVKNVVNDLKVQRGEDLPHL